SRSRAMRAYSIQGQRGSARNAALAANGWPRWAASMAERTAASAEASCSACACTAQETKASSASQRARRYGAWWRGRGEVGDTDNARGGVGGRDMRSNMTIAPEWPGRGGGVGGGAGGGRARGGGGGGGGRHALEYTHRA